MLCPKCNAEVVVEDVTCDICGADLTQIEDDEAYLSAEVAEV